MTGTGQLGLGEDQVDLHRVVGGFLAERCPPAVPRAYLDGGAQGLPPFWGEIAELGWLGIHLPESHGGGGGGLGDLAVVLEEMGRVVAPGPFLPTVLAGAVIDRLGSDEQRAEWLPGLAVGDVIGAVAAFGQEPGVVEAGRLSGHWGLVLGADVATLLVIPAEIDHDVRWVLVDRAKVEITVRPGVDETRGLADVAATGVLLPPAWVVGSGPSGVVRADALDRTAAGHVASAGLGAEASDRAAAGHVASVGLGAVASDRAAAGHVASVGLGAVASDRAAAGHGASARIEGDRQKPVAAGENAVGVGDRFEGEAAEAASSPSKPEAGGPKLAAAGAGASAGIEAYGRKPAAAGGGIAGEIEREGGGGGLVERLAVRLLAAEAAGAAAWCVDTAAAHAKVREQFGRPIGQFQAVKHRCADMLCQVELARAAGWDAARADDPLADAAAGALGPEALLRAAEGCIQVLGGIGFTWEHDAHLYLKRAMAVRALAGPPTRWRGLALGHARDGRRRRVTVELPLEAELHRTEVRLFLDDLRTADKATWRDRMAEAGYVAPHWPRPWGRGAGPLEQLVVDEEFAAAEIRRPHLQVAAWALPTLIAHGSDDQQARWIPPTLRGDLTWCQLFSEPGAGSDLASLNTKAVRVDGGWQLTGQKVWTTMAATSDLGICLARTDPTAPRHEGITCFVVDMRTPGVDIRPLRELTGHALFNEVFLTDVFVPDDQVVGAVGEGWQAARTTLGNERVSMGSGSSFGLGEEALLALLDQPAGQASGITRPTSDPPADMAPGGGSVAGEPTAMVAGSAGLNPAAPAAGSDSRSAGPAPTGVGGVGLDPSWSVAAGVDPTAADEVGRLLVEAHALAVLGLRLTLRAVASGSVQPGPEASVRKLLGVEHDQKVQEVGWSLLGQAGAATDGPAANWVAGYLANRCLTIAGGTSEIQRNVIAERLLGLPRDP